MPLRLQPGHSASSSFARYDPRHNKWFQIQSLQQEHADLCVCIVGEYIYAVAGRDYHEDLREVERYDPKTNTWEYVAPLKREVRRLVYILGQVLVGSVKSVFWVHGLRCPLVWSYDGELQNIYRRLHSLSCWQASQGNLSSSLGDKCGAKLILGPRQVLCTMTILS